MERELGDGGDAGGLGEPEQATAITRAANGPIRDPGRRIRRSIGALIPTRVRAEGSVEMNWQTTLADLGLILLFIGAFTLVVVRIAGRKG
jgi:hypothetical protein